MMDYVLKHTRVLREKRYKIIFISFFSPLELSSGVTVMRPQTAD